MTGTSLTFLGKTKKTTSKTLYKTETDAKRSVIGFRIKMNFEFVLKAPCKQSTHNLHLNYREYKML